MPALLHHILLGYIYCISSQADPAIEEAFSFQWHDNLQPETILPWGQKMVLKQHFCSKLLTTAVYISHSCLYMIACYLEQLCLCPSSITAAPIDSSPAV